MSKETELLQNMRAMLARAQGYSTSLQAHDSKFQMLAQETDTLYQKVCTLLSEQEARENNQ